MVAWRLGEVFGRLEFRAFRAVIGVENHQCGQLGHRPSLDPAQGNGGGLELPRADIDHRVTEPFHVQVRTEVVQHVGRPVQQWGVERFDLDAPDLFDEVDSLA